CQQHSKWSQLTF
nr:immunoglobulin light chain junction region [Macaca mulatta]